MARQPNWRRVKRNRNYTYEEAARLLMAHPRTVRNWVQRDGLPALAEQRPHLIVGSILSDFLRDRRQARKKGCARPRLNCHLRQERNNDAKAQRAERTDQAPLF